jgi:hypothetical protein
MRAAIENPRDASSTKFSYNISQSATSTANALREHHRGKSVFLTQSSRLALASSAAMEAGDVCCIFLGATVLSSRRRLVVGVTGSLGRPVNGVMAGELVHQYKHERIVQE